MKDAEQVKQPTQSENSLELEKKKTISLFQTLYEEQKSSFFELYNCEFQIRHNSICGIFDVELDHDLNKFLEHCSGLGTTLSQSQLRLENLLSKTKVIEIPKQYILSLQPTAITSSKNEFLNNEATASLPSQQTISKKKTNHVSSLPNITKKEEAPNRTESHNIKEMYKQRIIAHRLKLEQEERELKNSAAVLIQKNVRCFLQQNLYHRFLVSIRRFKRREYFRIWNHLALCRRSCRRFLQRRYFTTWKGVTEQFKMAIYNIKIRFWKLTNQELVKDVFQFLKTYVAWRKCKKESYEQRYIVFRRSHRVVSKWWFSFDKILCFRMSMFNKLIKVFKKILIHQMYHNWKEYVYKMKMLQLQIESFRQRSVSKFVVSCFLQFRDYCRYLRDNSDELWEMLRFSLLFMRKLSYLKRLFKNYMFYKPKQRVRIFFIGWKKRCEEAIRKSNLSQIRLISKRSMALLSYFSISQNNEQVNLLLSLRKVKLFWLKRKFWRLFISFLWKKYFCIPSLRNCLYVLQKKPCGFQSSINMYRNMYSDYLILKPQFFKSHLWNFCDRFSNCETFQFSNANELNYYYNHWNENKTPLFELGSILFWFIVFEHEKSRKYENLQAELSEDLKIPAYENSEEIIRSTSVADIFNQLEHTLLSDYIKYHSLFNKKMMILKGVRDEKIISDYYAKIASIHSSQRQLNSLLKYVKQQTQTNQVLEQVIDIEKEISTCKPLALHCNNESLQSTFEELFIPISKEDIERVRETEISVLQSKISSSTRPQIVLNPKSPIEEEEEENFNEENGKLDVIVQSESTQNKTSQIVESNMKLLQEQKNVKPLVFSDDNSSNGGFTTIIPLKGSTPNSRKQSNADGRSSQLSDSQMEALFVQKRAKLYQIANQSFEIDFAKVTIATQTNNPKPRIKPSKDKPLHNQLTNSHINPLWINNLIELCTNIEEQIENQWERKRERQKVMLETIPASEVTLFQKLHNLKANMESQIYELHDLYCKLVALVEFMRAKAIKNTSLTFQEVFFYNEVMKEVTLMKKKIESEI